MLTCSVRSVLYHTVASHGFSYLALHRIMLQSGCGMSTSIIWEHFNITYTTCVAFICFVYVYVIQDGLGSCIGEEFSYREGTVSTYTSKYGIYVYRQTYVALTHI